MRACIRAGEKSIGKRPQIDDSIPLEDTTDKIIDENNLSANGTSEILNDQYLRGLEHRYHLLYLRAIEVQFILEKQLKVCCLLKLVFFFLFAYSFTLNITNHEIISLPILCITRSNVMIK